MTRNFTWTQVVVACIQRPRTERSGAKGSPHLSARGWKPRKRDASCLQSLATEPAKAWTTAGEKLVTWTMEQGMGSNCLGEPRQETVTIPRKPRLALSLVKPRSRTMNGLSPKTAGCERQKLTCPMEAIAVHEARRLHHLEPPLARHLPTTITNSSGNGGTHMGSSEQDQSLHKGPGYAELPPPPLPPRGKDLHMDTADLKAHRQQWTALALVLEQLNMCAATRSRCRQRCPEEGPL